MAVYQVLLVLLLAVFAKENVVLGEPQTGPECFRNSDCKNASAIKSYCCIPYEGFSSCQSDCVGLMCFEDEGCGGRWNVYCCNYYCQRGKCGLPRSRIAVITISVGGAVVGVIGLAFCLYHYSRRNSRGQIVSGRASCVPATTTGVVFGSAITQEYVNPVVQLEPPCYVYGQPLPANNPPEQ